MPGMRRLTKDLASGFTVFWLLGMTQSINLIDGLDGLAGGIVAIAAGSFFVYSKHLGDVGLLSEPNIGPLIAIITLGSLGCVVCDESDNPRHVPSFPVTAVDTTAAGDAFAGALGFCLAQGQPIFEALCFASAAGAIATTRRGAQPAMPRLDEVNALLKPK